jgi:hypothetical protein
MAWQAECWRDVDRMRTQLRADLAEGGDRRLPRIVRIGVWAGLGALASLAGEPVAALPAIVVFEAFLAPRIGTVPPRTIGPLRPWEPPESFEESPEAPAPWVLPER